MVSQDELIPWLNSIEWRSKDEITNEAFFLIQEHLKQVRLVLKYVMKSQQIDNAIEAHGFIQSAGHNTIEGGQLIETLFSEVSFKNAEVRTGLIATIAACYCWHLDSDLKDKTNPWIPVMDLFEMGYTVTPEDDTYAQEVSLAVGYKNKDSLFLIM